MTPQDFFKNDLFAENTGVVLLEVRKGYSKAKLEIKPEHLNAGARTPVSYTHLFFHRNMITNTLSLNSCFLLSSSLIIYFP